MYLAVRLTVLGIFAIAGLSIAVSVCLQSPSKLATSEDPRNASSQFGRSPAGPLEGRVGISSANSSRAESFVQPANSSVNARLGSPPILPAGNETDGQSLSFADSRFERERPSSARSSHKSLGRFFETTLDQWTATYLPPVTQQFEQLDQAIKAARAKTQEESPAAEPATPQDAPPSATSSSKSASPKSASPKSPVAKSSDRAQDELPPPQNPTPQDVPTLEAVPAEIRVDSGKDLVSINAPNSDLREVFKTFSEAAGINILATRSVNGSVSVSLNNVDVNTALTAILKASGFASRREGEFLYVGTSEELQKMAISSDKVGTRVYRPNYVSAAELQKLIASMISPETGAISVSTAAEVGIASGADKAGGDTYAGSDVVVVRDFETVLERIDQVFEEIDRMPQQVVIETMILSVRLDDENTLGVNFELLREKANIRIVSGGTANSLANINFNDGLKIGFLDESLFAFLNALETIGDTNVIASPRVMCVNKQRAEILIGSELGYVSTTVTETAATQSVEFLEVGTHLRIRPFISNDGMVRLEVHPELSTGTVRVDQGFTLPDKEVTQVTSNVMCRSGATVVIGGLIREDLIATSQQIPVLGNLPIFGPLFRERTENTERREIIVLLTPKIVEEYDAQLEGEKGFTEFRDRRNALYDKFQPTNKRRIGERYGRLALSAWAAGEADVAFRYANLAIHYDPLHQDAINLRQEILTVYPAMEKSVDDHMWYGLWPWQHPARDYSGSTGWPWRQIGVEPRPIPVVSSDDGTTGPVREIVSDSPPVRR